MEISPAEKAALELVAKDPAHVLYVLQSYDGLVQRIDALEGRVRTTEAVEARPSSIEVGTPAKGGALKVYFDPAAPKEENNALVAEALRVLEEAGGAPRPNGGA